MVVNRKNRATSTRNKLAPGAARTANQAPLPVDESLTAESAESTTEVGDDASTDAIVSAELVVKPTDGSADKPAIATLSIEPTISVIIDEPTIVLAVETPAIEPADKPPESPSTARNKSKVSSNKSVQPTKGDKIMTQDAAKSSPVVAKKESAIAVTGSALPVRPVTPNAVKFVGMFSSAGDRPIGASGLVIFGTYLNGRPIEASSLKLFEMLPGDRPVFSDEMSYVPGTADGGRPIMTSPAGLMNAGEMMGSRPIFSNDIVDPNPATLMGYLD
ncbi:MAG: hypothetical protein LH631_01290 [Alkalinema sp. CAN_BIN05]|nr:hypothetical protein [Alkalinema sp. CAN_BIN05]